MEYLQIILFSVFTYLFYVVQKFFGVMQVELGDQHCAIIEVRQIISVIEFLQILLFKDFLDIWDVIIARLFFRNMINDSCIEFLFNHFSDSLITIDVSLSREQGFGDIHLFSSYCHLLVTHSLLPVRVSDVELTKVNII